MPDRPPFPSQQAPEPPARPIYLDNHATTRVDPRVVTEMLPWFDVQFGNAASINHRFGWDAAKAVVNARRQVAELIGAAPDDVLFTSGGTEANNLALKGILLAAPRGAHLVVSAAEHRSILDPAKRLKRQGRELTILPVDHTGRVEPRSVAAALRPDTVLVSVMLANN